MGKKRSFLPFEFLEPLSPSLQHNQQLHEWIIQKEALLIWTSFIQLVKHRWLFIGQHICKNIQATVLYTALSLLHHMQGIFLKYPLNARLLLLSPAGPKVAWHFQRDVAHTCEFQYFGYRLLLLPQTWSIFRHSAAQCKQQQLQEQTKLWAFQK